METIDCVIAGAGVVGLAVARALALAGREVVVLEAAEAIGTETSSRNSEVIHAGIYYPAGSLMARTCVEGRRALYRYCEERGVPFVVAVNTFPGAPKHPVEALRSALDLPDEVPMIDCDARLRASSRDVLMTLMRYLHSLAVPLT